MIGPILQAKIESKNGVSGSGSEQGQALGSHDSVLFRFILNESDDARRLDMKIVEPASQDSATGLLKVLLPQSRFQKVKSAGSMRSMGMGAINTAFASSWRAMSSRRPQSERYFARLFFFFVTFRDCCRKIQTWLL